MGKIKKYLLFGIVIIVIFSGPVSRLLKHNKKTEEPDYTGIVKEIYNETKTATESALHEIADQIGDALSKDDESTIDMPELIEGKLVRVVDGDTIIVNVDGEKKRVRLLCINTEESVAEEIERNNEYGASASEFLKDYLKDTDTVWLEYDTEQKDEYKRELCYVWLTDSPTGKDNASEMLNCMLVANGYAYEYVFEPNVKYRSEIEKYQKEAMENKTGLWEYPEFEEIAKKRIKTS